MPLAHALPAGVYPIVPTPFKVADFFSDLPPDISDAVLLQMDKIVLTFPPPLPPQVPHQHRYAEGAMMVPFVYPPVPTLHPDEYLVDQQVLRRRGRRSAAPAPLSPGRIGMPPDDVYPVMPPLPFPPPGFMPYPLLADQSTLTPETVFADWLDALERLPRVDMVAASAAGSIFDIRAQADSAGLTVEKLEELARNSRFAESDPEADDDKSDTSGTSDLELGYQNYLDYVSQIDTTNEYDRYAVLPRDNTFVLNSTVRNIYSLVEPRTLERGLVPESSLKHTYEYSDRDVKIASEGTELIPPYSERDISNASGALKERRRQELLQSYSQLETFAAQNKARIYARNKLRLLARLRLLQKSQIYFDDDKTVLENEELERYVSKQQALRDEQLLQLKSHQTYETARATLEFYQTSNRAYKNMNNTVINKLEKLKNLFEFQKAKLDEINNATGDPDIYNIRSKESAKLYNSFVEQNYANEIKSVFRAAALREEGVPDAEQAFDPSIFDKIFTERSHTANVHDFMPLVTKEEFELVTGEAPSKTGPAKDANNKNKGPRHQIFQSPVYDRATSGSDTTASDSGAPVVKRRPGRRAAPKPIYGEESSKLTSEAILVAKIMKQFVGPAAANADELTNDLDLMGVDTRWPVR